MEIPRNQSEAIRFAGLLREGLAQHLAGTLLTAHALATKLKKNEASEVVEAAQLVALLHAAIDDMSDLISNLQTGATDSKSKAPNARQIDQLIHDHISQEAAAAILGAGMLTLELEREGSPRAADARALTENLEKLAAGIRETVAKLKS